MKKRHPDFQIKTPCEGPQGGPWTPKPKWRVIGEAWTDGDTITCRIDLPVQNCRVILVPFEAGKVKDEEENTP